jgi:predicted PhzF superfamily epimerase YddE/YHI9
LGAREHPGLEVVRVFCADDGSGGNPLGVFVDGSNVPEGDRQPIAHELGFSETVFVDDPDRGEMRIFTPQSELPLAGHPLVGTAWLLRERGTQPAMLRPPAGEVEVRFEGELTYVTARPEWGPPWEFSQLDSPADVDALAAPPAERGELAMWAWLDESAGLVRARVFAPEDGIPEDEATGSAALQLAAQLGREIEIRQGKGSVIHARPLPDGRAEIAGRVVLDPDAQP